MTILPMRAPCHTSTSIPAAVELSIETHVIGRARAGILHLLFTAGAAPAEIP